MSRKSGLDFARYSCSPAILQDVYSAPDLASKTKVIRKFGGKELSDAGIEAVIEIANSIDYQRIDNLQSSGVTSE